MTRRMVLCVAILMGAATLRGEDLRTLELVWLDSHGLFRDFERVRSEADPIFRDLGVTVRWEVGTDWRPSAAGEARIQVVLMPSEPSGWGISANAMGVVLLPRRSQQDSVYLFYRPILRNVGLGRKAGLDADSAREAGHRPGDRSRSRSRGGPCHSTQPLSRRRRGHARCTPDRLSKQDIVIDGRTKEEFLRRLTE